MNRIMQGVVRGKSIELTEMLDVPDGENVEIEVRTPPVLLSWGEGIKSSAGGWADYPELDAVMQRIQQDRKQERRPQHVE